MAENDRPNEQVSKSVRASIRQSYPDGWFVAVTQDRVLAASASFRDLMQRIKVEGYEPSKVIVLEVGAEDPEFVHILADICRP